jgi:hypothetical protein
MPGAGAVVCYDMARKELIGEVAVAQGDRFSIFRVHGGSMFLQNLAGLPVCRITRRRAPCDRNLKETICFCVKNSISNSLTIYMFLSQQSFDTSARLALMPGSIYAYLMSEFFIPLALNIVFFCISL